MGFDVYVVGRYVIFNVVFFYFKAEETRITEKSMLPFYSLLILL